MYNYNELLKELNNKELSNNGEQIIITVKYLKELLNKYNNNDLIVFDGGEDEWGSFVDAYLINNDTKIKILKE